jgi:hypothetical protein
MNRYITKLIFVVQIENSSSASEFDEQIRIVESRDLEAAFYKARSIGRQEESTFKNSRNEKVCWKFIDVAEMYAIDELADGTQLYSTTHRTIDSDSYISYIRQKSIEIQLKSVIFA